MIVLSLGGNAIIRRGERGTAREQERNAALAMGYVARLVQDGTPLLITHGNGPIVGNMQLQSDAARGAVPAEPLYLSDADSEGGTGFIIQQALYNELRRLKIAREVVTLVSQVVVDSADPAFLDPTKPIGPFYTESEASKITRERAYLIKELSPGSFRRVVASPRPLRVVELEVIRRLATKGVIVIAAGGGGVPVTEDSEGRLHGIDAVIDKDLSTSLLAGALGARCMIILTNVEGAYLDFGGKGQKLIKEMNVSEARAYMEAGEFPAGSMGPKVEAAIEFLKGGGKEVFITNPESVEEVTGEERETGTRITS